MLANALLNMFLKCGKPELVIQQWKQFWEHFKPDSQSYFHVLIAAAAVGGSNISEVRQICDSISTSIIASDELLRTSLNTVRHILGLEGTLRISENESILNIIQGNGEVDENVLVNITQLADQHAAQNLMALVGSLTFKISPKISVGLFNMYRRHGMHDAGLALWKVCQKIDIDNILLTSILQVNYIIKCLKINDNIPLVCL